ncbi:DUF1831 domain-containing protein [Aerococcus urinae]|uniref:DUF1831 domain-containing protein n=1 Tax=Aerococcus urinae TaxID=1376 RepID=A0A0X8FET3_9LACT|nr:DUF1831 domain-containing protein [Aerococcus urinae]AMB95895.1 hypothetical protein AWM73_04945 [Aerococcus urinae]MCY3032481.1 DUF1831 domain-containing protein [Aerococcus urinae]MCY3037307.1 DUF1831 domain-containing protein [Aerococcus urinae]MCY3044527.1 DUF1831 domain-containing protein [Aerococcus urinae]MCY3046122.1 DUF1831 domain-containing protein [Aerococcus urinae]
MAFKEKEQLKGSQKIYQVHPNCKAYTLRDYGFTSTKAGNYQIEIPIRPEFQASHYLLLKVQIDKSVDKLQMNVTNKTGLKAVNVYQNSDMADLAKRLEEILADLVDKQVLAISED